MEIFADFHRFSLIFIEVLTMAENIEKQSFTFFAFLPPYIGVSGSLVSRMRKISMRSIDWYRKFLISCLAAPYSNVFVLYMDDYYSPVRRGTTDRYPPTWSDGILIILRGAAAWTVGG